MNFVWNIRLMLRLDCLDNVGDVFPGGSKETLKHIYLDILIHTHKITRLY